MRPREGQKHRPSGRADVISYACSASRRLICRALRKPHLHRTFEGLQAVSGFGSRQRRIPWRA